MQFRVITYNIHKGIGGVDRRYRLERIINTLERYQGDIVVMQEVDNDVPRSRHHRQVNEIGDSLGLRHRAYQQNVKLKQGHYGNAILSRFPLSRIENIDLTIPLKKRRRALAARCQLKDKHWHSMLIITCHLGLAGFERLIQLQKLHDSAVVKRVHHDTPIIIAGDYNDVWGTLGKRAMLPHGFLPVGQKINTFPAIMPVRQLDHIYYRGKLECVHSYAGHSDLARQASDHLPLIADFELPEA
ncbi:MAG: endonuclease/exonuclease/phosphatase family protein [Proteobacteria bacterium]|nr:endonuclease/exonuclease/phosphatase family protein [Pseudomonadota bacterium]